MNDFELSIEAISDATEWNKIVNQLGGHPLQLWGWGEVKSSGAWTPYRLAISDREHHVGAAQVLVRRLPGQFKALSYIPRGPVVFGDATGLATSKLRRAVMAALSEWCRSHIGGIGITFEPDWGSQEQIDLPGAITAQNPILHPTTLILDLTQSTDELLSVMAKKTRQYIRKSQREDIEFRSVESVEEINDCLSIYRQTAERAHFGIHEDEYYHRVAQELGEDSPIYAAFIRSTPGGRHDKPVSFVWFAASERTSFELYGGMTVEGQELRANYGLKWHAICSMKERGIERYDVNGLLNDGISTFKKGFANHQDELIGSIDIPFSMWYPLWNKGLPTAKKIVRKMRRAT